MSEQFIDGAACRLFEGTMKWWHGDKADRPTWDSITEEMRDVYRQSARDREFYARQNEQH
jgi:hypothetical protein